MWNGKYTGYKFKTGILLPAAIIEYYKTRAWIFPGRMIVPVIFGQCRSGSTYSTWLHGHWSTDKRYKEGKPGIHSVVWEVDPNNVMSSLFIVIRNRFLWTPTNSVRRVLPEWPPAKLLTETIYNADDCFTYAAGSHQGIFRMLPACQWHLAQYCENYDLKNDNFN